MNIRNSPLAPAVVDPKPDAVRCVPVVGTFVAAVSISRVLAIFENWIDDQRDHIVILRDVHGIMRARLESETRIAQEAADLIAPDGMPIVWLLRLAGLHEASRVCGIDLLPAACRYGLTRGWRHFLYGAGPGVGETLAMQMKAKYPGTQIVGTLCPPFRPLTPGEDAAVCAEIRAARPHILWVSLSTPKQDIWMTEHRGRCGNVVMVGVGGAFEINAELIRRAPHWMRTRGFEWLYRLTQEPARLWGRYLRYIPLFLVLASFEFFRRRSGLAKVLDNSSRT
jgi:N-acetylglucosaminyldiphosphoundecaprenol N-acetyl-beta-D-mannosaminyltransferase